MFRHAQGNVIVVGRKSPFSLYNQQLSSFEDDEGAYDQKDAAGFIKLQALRLKYTPPPPRPAPAAPPYNLLHLLPLPPPASRSTCYPRAHSIHEPWTTLFKVQPPVLQTNAPHHKQMQHTHDIRPCPCHLCPCFTIFLISWSNSLFLTDACHASWSDMWLSHATLELFRAPRARTPPFAVFLGASADCAHAALPGRARVLAQG